MKLFGKLMYGMFIILLIGVAGLFLATLLPIPGNIEIKIVKSGSMEPALHTGSIVVVKPQESYAVGDVITFGEDSKQDVPTTHRILSIDTVNGQTLYTTKGDANEESDPEKTLERDVIGKVVGSAPYAGYIIDFARQPTGFILLIVVPASIVIIDELFRIGEEIIAIRRKRKEDQSV